MKSPILSSPTFFETRWEPSLVFDALVVDFVASMCHLADSGTATLTSNHALVKIAAKVLFPVTFHHFWLRSVLEYERTIWENRKKRASGFFLPRKYYLYLAQPQKFEEPLIIPMPDSFIQKTKVAVFMSSQGQGFYRGHHIFYFLLLGTDHKHFISFHDQFDMFNQSCACGC